MKKIKIKNFFTIVLLVIMVMALAVGCMPNKGQVADSDQVESESEGEKTLEVVSVETSELSKSTINEEIYTFGYLEPKDTYVVTPYSSGIVELIMVNVGDYVTEGDLLYQLGGDDLQISKERDELTRNSSINSAKLNLDSQELNLAQRESDLTLRQMTLDTSKDNYEKNLSLFESNIISQSELDNAKNTYDQAVISYEQAALTLESTRISYESAKISYNESVQNYSLTVDDYNGREDDLYITTPISGLVTDVSVQEDIMNNGSSGITIVDNSLMLLKVNVMEKYIYDIKEGQEVELTLEYKDQVIYGTVTDISLVANNGYYPIEITLDNADKSLVSGMYTEGYIKTKSKEHVFKVEKSILLQDVYNNDFVYIVNEDTMTASMVQVERGIEEKGFVEIIGDIKTGDRMITVGQDYIVDGQPIKIVEGLAGL